MSGGWTIMFEIITCPALKREPAPILQEILLKLKVHEYPGHYEIHYLNKSRINVYQSFSITKLNVFFTLSMCKNNMFDRHAALQ